MNACIHNAYFCMKLFGGYATSRKTVGFARLALNSYKNLIIKTNLTISAKMGMW